MRVEGKQIPMAIQIEQVPFQQGMAEVSLRENIREKAEEGLYVYDEYRFQMADRPDLEAEIQKNLPHWLAVGRNAEVKAKASILCDLRSGLDALYQGVTE